MLETGFMWVNAWNNTLCLYLAKNNTNKMWMIIFNKEANQSPQGDLYLGPTNNWFTKYIVKYNQNQKNIKLHT